MKYRLVILAWLTVVTLMLSFVLNPLGMLPVGALKGRDQFPSRLNDELDFQGTFSGWGPNNPLVLSNGLGKISWANFGFQVGAQLPGATAYYDGPRGWESVRLWPDPNPRPPKLLGGAFLFGSNIEGWKGESYWSNQPRHDANYTYRPLALSTTITGWETWLPFNYTFTVFMPKDRETYVYLISIKYTGGSPIDLWATLWVTYSIRIGNGGDVYVYYDQSTNAIVANATSANPSQPLWAIFGSPIRFSHINLTSTKTMDDLANPNWQMDRNPNYTEPIAVDSSGQANFRLGWRWRIPTEGYTFTIPIIATWSGSGAHRSFQHALDNYQYLSQNYQSSLQELLNDYSTYLNSKSTIVLGNPVIDAAQRWAKVVLKMSSYPKGLYVLGWDGYWLRDSSWGNLGSLAGGEFQVPMRQVKAWLEQIKTDKWNGYSDDLILIVSAAETYRYTQNSTWLKEVYEPLMKYIDAVLSTRWNSTYNLIDCPPSYSDWEDDLRSSIVPSSKEIAFVTFVEVLAYKALMDGSFLSVVMGDLSRSSKYLGYASRIKTAINQYLWEPSKGFYADFMSKSGNREFPDKFSADGNLLAIIWDVADSSAAHTIINQVYERHMDKPPMMTVSPVYHYPFEVDDPRWATASQDYRYQNGGHWPWLGALLVAAETKLGRQAYAYNALCSLATMTNMAIPFTFGEWYLNDTSLGGVTQFEWSAGMYLWAENYYLGLNPDTQGIRVNPVSGESPFAIFNYHWKEMIFNITYSPEATSYRITVAGPGEFELRIMMFTTAQPAVGKDGRVYSDWQSLGNGTLLIRNLSGPRVVIDISIVNLGPLIPLFYTVGVAVLVTVTSIIAKLSRMSRNRFLALTVIALSIFTIAAATTLLTLTK